MGKPKGKPFMMGEYDKRMEYDALVHHLSQGSGQNVWYEHEGDNIVFYTDGDLDKIEKFMMGAAQGLLAFVGMDRETFEMGRDVHDAHKRAGANARWN